MYEASLSVKALMTNLSLSLSMPFLAFHSSKSLFHPADINLTLLSTILLMIPLCLAIRAISASLSWTVHCKACLNPVPIILRFPFIILLRILSFSFCCLSNSSLSCSSLSLSEAKYSLIELTPITCRLWPWLVSLLINWTFFISASPRPTPFNMSILCFNWL